MNKKKVIFIGGTSYSGSTMLDMMLSNHPKAFSLGEISALFRPFRPHHFNPACGCNDETCTVWDEVKSAGERGFYQKVFEMFPEVDYLVDSSKNQWWIYQQSERLIEQGFDVEHILIWKSPEYFAHSMLKRGQWKWKKSWVNYHRQYLTLVPSFISVSYESLVKEPSLILNNICDACGIDYAPSMEKFWSKQHHTIFGNKSAKIHLNEEATNPLINNENEGLEIKQSTELSHRKIYIDKGYINELPTDISNEIKSCEKLSLIQELILNCSKKGATINVDGKAEMLYGDISMVLFRVLNSAKELTGKLLGKYFWLY